MRRGRCSAGDEGRRAEPEIVEAGQGSSKEGWVAVDCRILGEGKTRLSWSEGKSSSTVASLFIGRARASEASRSRAVSPGVNENNKTTHLFGLKSVGVVQLSF